MEMMTRPITTATEDQRNMKDILDHLKRINFRRDGDGSGDLSDLQEDNSDGDKNW